MHGIFWRLQNSRRVYRAFTNSYKFLVASLLLAQISSTCFVYFNEPHFEDEVKEDLVFGEVDDITCHRCHAQYNVSE